MYRLAFPPTTRGGFGSGASSAPVQDWNPKFLRPDPQPGLVQLCKDVPAHIGLLYGVPVVMTTGGGSESQVREAYRRFIAATIQPLATIIGEALSATLGEKLTLDLTPLRAYDHQGQARTVRTLVDSGDTLTEAKRIAGLLDE